VRCGWLESDLEGNVADTVEAVVILDPSVWTAKIFVSGWTRGGGEDLPVREPATGQQLGALGTASAQDVTRAAAQASQAQREWARRTPQERAGVMRRAAELWVEHRAEIQDWIVRESGSVPGKAAGEVSGAAEECRAGASLPTHPHGVVLPSEQTRWSFARRRPAGVVAVIAPFNFPLSLAIRSVVPALALGNAVLLKPDPRTSVCGGVAIVRIFQAAGLPEGLLQLLPGAAPVGEAMVTAPEVRIVSFTGSTRAGRAVAELGGRHLKRVHLELGGNSALLVLPGANVSLAASAGAFGSFAHQGQICMTTGRHLVHQSLHDAYVEALAQKAATLKVGNPALEEVALGPVIDGRQLQRIDGLVHDAVSAGATLAAGGTHDGLFYRPTVLADVAPSMRVYAEEVFGPVAPVVPVADVEEAIALASSSDYGLSLGILGDVGQAMRVADVVPSGLVHINEQTVADEINVPFGGVGVSGTGSRIGGSEANIEAFTETQWLTVRGDIAPYPF
jgi:benzaldehyde dehydrogenase (NAD)